MRPKMLDVLLLCILILIVIAAVVGAVVVIMRAQAESYSARMNSNAAVLARLVGEHRVTIGRDAVMSVAPAESGQGMMNGKSEFIDPRAFHAVRLIKTSLDEYGSRGDQIIPANKIRGMSPNTRDDAVKYLTEKGWVMIERKGAIEITRAKIPLAAILAQLPPIDPDLLDKAVTALPHSSNGDNHIDDNGNNG